MYFGSTTVLQLCGFGQRYDRRVRQIDDYRNAYTARFPARTLPKFLVNDTLSLRLSRCGQEHGQIVSVERV